MSSVESVFFLSMIPAGLLGAVLGFYLAYRSQKKLMERPSLDYCIYNGAARGLMFGALYWLAIPGGVLLGAILSIIALAKMALEKTGKFSE